MENESENTGNEKSPNPFVSVDFQKGRWGRKFHFHDGEGKEIVLSEADARALALQVVEITERKQCLK